MRTAINPTNSTNIGTSWKGIRDHFPSVTDFKTNINSCAQAETHLEKIYDAARNDRKQKGTFKITFEVRPLPEISPRQLCESQLLSIEAEPDFGGRITERIRERHDVSSARKKHTVEGFLLRNRHRSDELHTSHPNTKPHHEEHRCSHNN